MHSEAVCQGATITGPAAGPSRRRRLNRGPCGPSSSCPVLLRSYRALTGADRPRGQTWDTLLPVMERRTWLVIAGAALLSVVVRLRMLWSPVSVDEGGYLAIARGWSHGQVLYRDVFVDRPQGLLALFRVWDWVSGGSTGSIRIMAMLFGVLLVVSTGVVVREVAGGVAAGLAAVTCAVVSSAPVLEGDAANTELLSGAVAAAGLAVGVLACRKRHPLLWFYGAGLLAGAALSLKQSGFDGLVALLASLALTVVFAPRLRAAALKAAATLIGGLATVTALLMAHGALTGWSRWWTAVAGYRLRTQSAFASADWLNLASTVPYAIVVLGTSALLAVLGVEAAAHGLGARLRETMAPGAIILLLWFLASAGGFLIGGGFWRHYWLLLAAPLSALAGVGLAQLPKLRVAALLAALTPCLAITVWVYAGDSAHLSVRAAGDHHAAVDQLVASWFAKHRQPGQNLYVLCASAGAYADAHQDPGYPYLWFVEVRHAPNAERRLVAYLSDQQHGPQFVAEYERVSSCDPSGGVEKVLRRSFTRVGAVGSVTMLERTPLATPATDSAVPVAAPS